MKNKISLPLLTSAFEPLPWEQVFSKLDLRNACHLVRMRKRDKRKTALNTPLGQFKYLVVLFGLNNAPAVFQPLVNDGLRDFLNGLCSFTWMTFGFFCPGLKVNM